MSGCEKKKKEKKPDKIGVVCYNFTGAPTKNCPLADSFSRSVE